MSSDVGQARRAPKRSLRVWGVIVAGSSLMLAVVAAVLAMNSERRVEEARAWTVSGAPCPVLDADAFAAAGLSAAKMFEYDGVVFGRAAGHADCNEIGARGGSALGGALVCHFTGPATLTVRTRTAEARYRPGVGRPVTVMIEKGEPRCVLGSNFKL